MTDIFREVEEEVRRERFEKLWKQYGAYIVAGLVVVLLAVGGWQFWKYYERTQREESASAYLTAMRLTDSGKPLDAAAAFAEIAENGASNYHDVARLAQANALVMGNKLEDALKIYKDVAETAGNKDLGDVARIRTAWLMVDAAPLSEVQKVIAPLMDGANVWRFMAQEILAYSRFTSGQTAEAQKGYEILASDAAAPEGIRQRARMMAQFIASGAGDNFGTVPTPPKPPTPAAATTTPATTAPATGTP